jgi:hypothetical protein
MEGHICKECGRSIHRFNTTEGDCFYCANCDRDYLESEVEWGTIPVIGVDRIIDKDTSLIVGVNNKFYIGVIQSEDGTYHIDLHTPLGVFEEFDYCPEEDEDEDNN